MYGLQVLDVRFMNDDRFYFKEFLRNSFGKITFFSFLKIYLYNQNKMITFQLYLKSNLPALCIENRHSSHNELDVQDNRC